MGPPGGALLKAFMERMIEMGFEIGFKMSIHNLEQVLTHLSK